MKKPLIVIAGPTAVGKTSLSIELAKKINGEIISADSMQVYKYMDIGTAKIKEEDKQGITHYLIDELFPDESFNVQIFQSKAKAYMEQIYSKNKVPILVGGTGFYIQALIYDIDFTESKSDGIYREYLQEFVKTKGNDILHQKLKIVDPKSADKIHPNNVKRVIRALEYYEETKEVISLHNEREKSKKTPYNLAYYLLNMDRELLYKRINKRVDMMIHEGLFEEVKMLKNKGYAADLVSMKGLGYKEVYGYLNGKYDKERAIYILKQGTRHFAKRQLTWFKREEVIRWLNISDYDFDDILKKILKDIEELRII